VQHLSLIGIGTGNPDHLTLAGIKAMNLADLILVPRKGADKDDLAAVRLSILDAHLRNPATRVVSFDMPVRDPRIADYTARVEAWHDAIARVWADTLAGQAPAARVALLVWGDPSLYDSTLRIAARLRPQPKVTVEPGITALQALTAAHAIPLNALGGPVVITTGRALRDAGFPVASDTCAVMLDGDCAFQSLDPKAYHIWWGANLGLDSQSLCSGPLQEAGPRILAARAQVRAAHGWVMDIYLLRRQTQP
jgi:precorrin-6A synthase